MHVNIGTSRLYLRIALLGFSVTAFLGATILIQQELERRDGGQAARLEQLRLLPRGEVLRPALLGYHHFGSDIIWLRVIQELGERMVRDKDYEWLYHALDVVTTLDPKYVYAYESGGTVLAELAKRVDWSNQLLEKGLEPNPTAWRIPFVLGFNHFFYLEDHLRAAEYMARSARAEGLPSDRPPPYVARLAARLYAQGKSPEVAIEFLEKMLQQTPPGLVRDQLERRIKRITVERDLQHLERNIQRYVESKGKNPASLTELVTTGFISQIPEEPYGGEYRLDPKTGEVTSTTHTERVRAYHASDGYVKKGDIE